MPRRKDKRPAPPRLPLVDPKQQDQALRDLMPVIEWLTAADTAFVEGAPKLGEANLHAALAALRQVGPSSPAVKAYLRWLELNTIEMDSGKQKAVELQMGFGEATREAVAKAHRQGLAVPGRRAGVALEVLPGGKERPIDETKPWSPKADC